MGWCLMVVKFDSNAKQKWDKAGREGYEYNTKKLWSNISHLSILTVNEENKVYFLGRGIPIVFKSEPSNLGSFPPGYQQGPHQLLVGF